MVLVFNEKYEMIEDCLDYPLLLTNGPGSYYVRNVGFIRDIRSIIINCEGLWFPYKLDGEWYVNIQTKNGSGDEERGLFRKAISDMIIDDRWEVRLGSGS